jgi:hypothetical protein
MSIILTDEINEQISYMAMTITTISNSSEKNFCRVINSIEHLAVALHVLQILAKASLSKWTAVPKYLNVAVCSKDVVTLFVLRFVLHSGDETTTDSFSVYFQSSAITSL